MGKIEYYEKIIELLKSNDYFLDDSILEEDWVNDNSEFLKEQIINILQTKALTLNQLFNIFFLYSNGNIISEETVEKVAEFVNGELNVENIKLFKVFIETSSSIEELKKIIFAYTHN